MHRESLPLCQMIKNFEEVSIKYVRIILKFDFEVYD